MIRPNDDPGVMLKRLTALEKRMSAMEKAHAKLKAQYSALRAKHLEHVEAMRAEITALQQRANEK